jgi:WD40 repeat protein
MRIQRAVFTASDRFFLALAFSPDGKLLAAGQQDGTITIWNIATKAEWFAVQGRDVATPDWSAAVEALAFSSDGRILAGGGGDGVVTLFDVDNKRVMTRFPAQESAIASLVFSPNSTKLFSGTHEGKVRCWDLATGEASILFQSGGFYRYLHTIALDPLGKRLAVGGLRHDRAPPWGATLLDVENRFKQVAEIELFNSAVLALSFSRDSKLLAAAGAGRQVTLRDGITGDERATLPIHPGGKLHVAFSPTADILAIGIGTANCQPSHVSLWDTKENRQLASFVCHNDMISQLAWSPNGKLLATASADSTVQLWDVPMILGQ